MLCRLKYLNNRTLDLNRWQWNSHTGHVRVAECFAGASPGIEPRVAVKLGTPKQHGQILWSKLVMVCYAENT